jgi:hypothetical protein
MILPAADDLLAPVMATDGFRLACLIDGSTGMVLASLENQDGPPPSTAAAGAADVINVLTLLSGRLATGENLEDVMVTFSDSFFMVRPLFKHGGLRASRMGGSRPPFPPARIPPGGLDQEPQILLLVIADRQRTNLAMAHRSIRDFCASFTS